MYYLVVHRDLFLFNAGVADYFITVLLFFCILVIYLRIYKIKLTN